MKFSTRTLLFLLPALLLAPVMAGCKGSVALQPDAGKTPVPVVKTDLTLKGVGLSPNSTSPEDFTGFFQKAKEAGNAVMWAGDWQELDSSNAAPAVVAGLASQYGCTPIIEAQFFTQSTGK